jgi:hypothetical protein
MLGSAQKLLELRKRVDTAQLRGLAHGGFSHLSVGKRAVQKARPRSAIIQRLPLPDNARYNLAAMRVRLFYYRPS